MKPTGQPDEAQPRNDGPEFSNYVDMAIIITLAVAAFSAFC